MVIINHHDLNIKADSSERVKVSNSLKNRNFCPLDYVLML